MTTKEELDPTFEELLSFIAESLMPASHPARNRASRKHSGRLPKGSGA